MRATILIFLIAFAGYPVLSQQDRPAPSRTNPSPVVPREPYRVELLFNYYDPDLSGVNEYFLRQEQRLLLPHHEQFGQPFSIRTTLYYPIDEVNELGIALQVAIRRIMGHSGFMNDRSVMFDQSRNISTIMLAGLEYRYFILHPRKFVPSAYVRAGTGYAYARFSRDYRGQGTLQATLDNVYMQGALGLTIFPVKELALALDAGYLFLPARIIGDSDFEMNLSALTLSIGINVAL